MSISFGGLNALLLAANTISKSNSANANNLVFQEIMETSDFTMHHSISTGIEANDMVPVLEKTKQYGFLKASDITQGCNFNQCSVVDTITHQFWSPNKYDCELEICLSAPSFTRDFKAFWNLNCADYDKNVDSVLIAYIIDRVKDYHNQSLWRIAYFDYKANPNPGFAGIDGLFVQYQAVATTTNVEQRVVITENSATTIAGQMTLTADAGKNYLKAMYDKMMEFRPHLLNKVGLRFEITRKLATNYLHWLQENREVNCCYNMNHDGTTSSGYNLNNLNYMGIPILIRDEWTDIIVLLAGASATVYDKPNRILLTYDGNKAIGTCDEDQLKHFKIVFDEVTEIIHVRAKTTLDVKVPLVQDFILAI